MLLRGCKSGLLMLFVLSMGCSSTTKAPSYTLVQQSDAAVLLAPGATVELRIKVTDSGGAIQASKKVRFVGPANSTLASGTFVGADSSAPTVIEVDTDAMGIATVSWTANGSTGPYTVDVVVPETLGTDGESYASFAITQTSVATPAVTAAAVEQRVRAEILSAAQASATQRLYGPFLLEDGDVVVADEPTGLEEAATPTTIQGATWLVWIDDYDGLKFDHPTRFVLLSATDANATPTVVDARYWPKLTRGQDSAPLLSAVHLSGPEMPGSVSGSSSSLSTISKATAALEDPSKACAISIAGPADWFLKRDAAAARDFFKNNLKIPNVYSKTTFTGATRPASFDDLEGFLMLAANDKCEKLFLYITAHGYNSSSSPDAQGVSLWNPNGKNDDAQSGISYDAIANVVQKYFSGKKVCIIIDACNSGTALTWFQGRGFSGEILTASNNFLKSSASLLRSHFSEALFDCWEDFLENDSRSTAGAAYEWVLDQNSHKVVRADPQSGQIFGDTLFVDMPDVSLKVGQAKTLKINVPSEYNLKRPSEKASCDSGSCGISVQRYKALTEVADPSIGKALGAPFNFDQPIEILFKGDKEGMTTYTATVYIGGRALRGMGKITVVSDPDCTDAVKSAGETVATDLCQQPLAFFATVLCGVFDVDLPHSDGNSSKSGAGDHTQTRGRVTGTQGLSQQKVDQLFNNSTFECDQTNANGATTLCPASVLPMPAGDVHIVQHVLYSAIPLSDPTNTYQYGFVFDSDDNTSNNYQASPSFPNDFFQDTDRWYTANYDPVGGWVVRVQTADNNSTVQDVASAARIIIDGASMTLVAPASEFTSSAPKYRVTAFRHTGDFGISAPHDWNGDVQPRVNQGLSSF